MTGTLEVGKWADISVLSIDPLNVAQPADLFAGTVSPLSGERRSLVQAGMDSLWMWRPRVLFSPSWMKRWQQPVGPGMALRL